MSDRPIKVEINCETGEETSTPLTDEEIQELQAADAARQAQQRLAEAEAQAKAEAKASATAKLAALGLTADEIAALS